MSGNRLGDETSPYLLQHADNPVHWQPWDDQAFAQARRENKPILLSVGYAACHWCHVMAHESFEDDDTASLMNSHFVNVKVDREERPDVDALYQKALSLMGEHGGWPLTMFLTPDGEPFWGGTYFPPASRYGRPSFATVLTQIAEAWENRREAVDKNVGAMREALVKTGSETGRTADMSLDLLDRAASSLLDHVDGVNGGLQGAPKFPMPWVFEFLWRGWRRSGDARLREAVLTTVDRICRGGIYDHIGGGFARYSTDEHWLAPHFEKMLYDNALLIDLLVMTWQETRRPLYAARIAETVEWLQREMMAENGAFASSLDADSEGEEGRFYVWSEEEVDRLLGPRAEVFKRAYDVGPEGNWEGKTILHRNGPQPEETAESEAELAECRRILLDARDHRVRPGRDDKVLADWNGLMIAALARAGMALERRDWIDVARGAYDGILRTMQRGDGLLGHSFRNGRLQPQAFLDDYAAMTRAALLLHEASGDPALLEQARVWVLTVDEHYRDDAEGGYFFTSDDAEDLLVRSKSVTDTATPSGNGMMLNVLARLWYLTGDHLYRDRADELLAALTPETLRHFPSSATMMNAFEVLVRGIQVVVVGEPAEPGARELRHAAAASPEPNVMVAVAPPGVPLPPGHPAEGKGPVDGKPAAYVCRGQTCSLPVTEPEALRAALDERYPSTPA